MKDFIHSVKFKILVGILALLVGIMLYAAKTSGDTSYVSSFFGAIFSPIQKVSTTISNKVSTTLDMLVNSDDYYKDNQELKEKLNEMYNQLVDYKNIKDENAQLKEVLGLKEHNPDLKFSPPCKIIGRTTNDLYQSFFIDRGSRDGIKLRDPVITKEGLVGIVSDVQLTYSKVTTVLSPQFPIGVYSVDANVPGTIQGDLESAEKGLTKMLYISRDSNIKTGDVIVTSGTSGLVPKNRIIGTVEEVSPDKGGLSLVATIKPIVNIESLTDVFVLVGFEGQGDGFDEHK